MDTHYGVYEAARELGCSSQWIRVLLAERRLDGARKVGRQWRIPKAALDSLKQRREGGASNLYHQASQKLDAMVEVQKQVGVTDPELDRVDAEIAARLAPDFRVTHRDGELLVEPATSTDPRLGNLRALQQVGKINDQESD
jgi:excisionase family DNA binding protein